MDLGPNVEVILGTPWLKSLGPHMADWDAGTLTFRDRHRTVTLKSKRRGQRGRATWEGIEFITAEQAMKDLYTLERLAKRSGSALPPQSGWVFLEPSGYSSPESQPDAAHHDSDAPHPSSEHLEPEPDPPEPRGSGSSFDEEILNMIAPEDRDSQSPFGREYELKPSADKHSLHTLPTSATHDTVSGLLGFYAAHRAQALQHQFPDGAADTSVPKLTPLMVQRRQSLFDSLRALADKQQTLGELFWTEQRRNIMSRIFLDLYDDVVFREQISGRHTGSSRLPQAKIRMKDTWDGKAPWARAMRMSDAHLEVMRSQLNELLEAGIIRPSASPFGASCFIVPKPHTDGKKFRMVVSYKSLNDLVVSDRFPLPCIPTILNKIAGKSVLSTVDIVSAFYQNAVYAPHIERTAMTTQFGQFEWNFLPMGLSVAPAIQQRNITLALHGPLKPEYVPDAADPWRKAHPCYPELSSSVSQAVDVFIDDTICYSNSVEEHATRHLPAVLERLKIYGLEVKGSKANLFKREADFLGFRLTTDGLAPQESKLRAVRDFPMPKNLTQLRAFIGLVSFYRKFIYNFSQRALPLTALTKKDVPFPRDGAFTDEQVMAFVNLKLAMTQAPVLTHFNWRGAYEGTHMIRVQTDASQFAMGAVISQEVDEGGAKVHKPVAFASKSFNSAESNYSATERELRALVYACTEEFRHYLVGLPSYELQGDHRPLEALLSAKEYSGRLFRWLERLHEYNVPKMKWVPGTKLVVPDALSRRGDYEELMQPIRDSLSVKQRQEWGLVNPEATYGNTKAGPLPDVVGRPSAPGIHTFRPAHLQHVPPAVDTTRASSVQADCSSLTGEPDPPGVGSSASALAQATAGIFELALREPGEAVKPIRFESPNSAALNTEAYAASPKLLKDLAARTQPFDLDVSPRSLSLAGAPHLADAQDQQPSRWAGHSVIADCTRGELFSGQIAKLIETFSKARSLNPRTSGVFIIPFHPHTAHQWEEQVKAEGSLSLFHCFGPGNSSDFVRAKGPDRTSLRPYVTKAATQVWHAQAENTAVLHAVTRSSSRQTPKEAGQPISLDNLLSKVREAYSSDRDVSRQINELQKEGSPTGTRPKRREFAMFGDLLLRTTGENTQLVLPLHRELINFALKLCHDDSTAGHLGYVKTLEKVQRRFFWKNMHQEVKDYVSSCLRCQKTKGHFKTIGRAHLLDHPLLKWAVLSLDFITGLPLSKFGFDAILTVTDKCTKMVHLIPLRFNDSKGSNIAKLLRQHVFRLHGYPLELLSDRDTRFTSVFWKELQEGLGTGVRCTTPFHPQGNGAAENTNRTLEQILRAFCDDRQRNWDECLPAAEFALNDAKHFSTQMSPFELNYGFSPRSQVDLTLRCALQQKLSSEARTIAQQWLDDINSMQEKLSRAHANVLKAQAQQQAQFYKHRLDVTFSVGDKVMVSSKHITRPVDRGTQHKLRSSWIGPLTVIKVFLADDGLPAAYKLDMPPEWGPIHHTVSQDKLKPYKTADCEWPLREELPPPETEIVRGQLEYVVEAVLADRMSRGKRQWLVRWKGFSSDYDKWLTFERLNTGGVNEQWRNYEKARHAQQGSVYEEPSDEQVQSVTPDHESSVRLFHHSLFSAIFEYRHVRRVTHVRDHYQTISRRTHRNAPYKFLVLYSGTGSVEKVLHELFPNADILSIDIDPKSNASLICDVRSWAEDPYGLSSYSPGSFHAVWASPPCTEFSVAKAAPFQQSSPSSPRNYLLADQLVQVALHAIQYLQPHFWYVENPRGGLRHRPYMQAWEPFRLSTSYCKYGAPYRKTTDIWTNAAHTTREAFPLIETPCSPSSPCQAVLLHRRHDEVAQLGPSSSGQSGQHTSSALYRIPRGLLKDLFKPLALSSWVPPELGHT